MGLACKGQAERVYGDPKCYGNSKLHLGSSYARIQRELMATAKADIEEF